MEARASRLILSSRCDSMYLQIRCVSDGERPPRLSGGTSVLDKSSSLGIRGCACTIDSGELCEPLDLLRGGRIHVFQPPRPSGSVKSTAMALMLPPPCR